MSIRDKMDDEFNLLLFLVALAVSFIFGAVVGSDGNIEDGIIISQETADELCGIITSNNGSVALDYYDLSWEERDKLTAGSLICKEPTYDSTTNINILK